MAFSSISLAQSAVTTPSVSEKSTHLPVLTKSQQEKRMKFKECLNNRPAEAEAYDCYYIFTMSSPKPIRVAAKKNIQRPFKTAALE